MIQGYISKKNLSIKLLDVVHFLELMYEFRVRQVMYSIGIYSGLRISIY